LGAVEVRRFLKRNPVGWTPAPRLPNGKTDLGSWHDLSANLYGMNHGWPDGGYADRERIYREHLRFTQGLLWLLANDPRNARGAACRVEPVGAGQG